LYERYVLGSGGAGRYHDWVKSLLHLQLSPLKQGSRLLVQHHRHEELRSAKVALAAIAR
jgi:hypothetical protein